MPDVKKGDQMAHPRRASPPLCQRSMEDLVYLEKARPAISPASSIPVAAPERRILEREGEAHLEA